MKRLFVLAAAASAAVLVVVAVNASAGHKPGRGHDHGRGHHHGATLTVVEHATTDAVTNGSSGDAAGNILTFANDVFDANDGARVGTDQGVCTRIVVGKSWECIWTTFLPRGQITVEGPFYDTGDSTLAITGGTGAYRNVRGEMELKYHNPAGTEFDFVFHLIG
jgi:hypothetical protein